MASKQELEKLDIIRLAALCENVARSSAIDKQIAAQAASGRIRSSGWILRRSSVPNVARVPLWERRLVLLTLQSETNYGHRCKSCTGEN